MVISTSDELEACEGVFWRQVEKNMADDLVRNVLERRTHRVITTRGLGPRGERERASGVGTENAGARVFFVAALESAAHATGTLPSKTGTEVEGADVGRTNTEGNC